MIEIYDCKTKKTLTYEEKMKQRSETVNRVVNKLFLTVVSEEMYEEDIDRMLYLFNSQIKEWKNSWKHKERETKNIEVSFNALDLKMIISMIEDKIRKQHLDNDAV